LSGRGLEHETAETCRVRVPGQRVRTFIVAAGLEGQTHSDALGAPGDLRRQPRASMTTRSARRMQLRAVETVSKASPRGSACQLARASRSAGPLAAQSS